MRKIKKFISSVAEKVAHKAISVAINNEQKAFKTALQARLIATVVKDEEKKLERIEHLGSWVDGRAAALRSMAARS